MRILVYGGLAWLTTEAAWGQCLDDRPSEHWDVLRQDKQRQIKTYVRHDRLFFTGVVNLPGNLQRYRSILLDPAHYAEWFWLTERVRTLPVLPDGTPQLGIVRKLPFPEVAEKASWGPDARVEICVKPMSADATGFSAHLLIMPETASASPEAAPPGMVGADSAPPHPVTPASSPESGRSFYCPDDV